jgi:phosphatidylserine decarboxylase
MRSADPLTPGSRLFVALQHLLPQHALSSAMFWLTRRRTPVMVPWAIRLYARFFAIDLAEAARPEPDAYANFNAFFTRALRPGARPLTNEAGAIACPVDGRVSEAGRIQQGQLLQAKGHHYELGALLGGNPALAERFNDGLFATFYLSPRDYHRIHMPVSGQLSHTIHVPGRLFSVNPTTVAGVPGLFARNERVICLFETDHGPMAVILVGAIFVGSIETIWAGRLTPPRARAVTIMDPGLNPVQLERGTELGRFNMGSTVILLFPQGVARWSSVLDAGAPVRCGSVIGHINIDGRSTA